MLKNISRESDVKASKQALEALEEVLAEMGAELHDDLIQRLSILRLHFDKLKQCLGDAAVAERAINEIQLEFDGIAGSVRRISKSLRPAKIDGETFEQALRTLCSSIDGPQSARIELTSIGVPQFLPGNHELFLLRMIQELIQNALRHSSAWHVWVRLNWAIKSLHIEVEDDGTRFVQLDDTIALLQKRNNTLRMRAVALGAKIDYKVGAAGLLAVIDYNI
jgi:signal transduction histidine kinase